MLRWFTHYVCVVRTFGSELFEYITNLIPYWRVSDEAWSVASGHLTGVGVERNLGGQVMVMAWNQDTSRKLASVGDLPESFLKRIVVVVDDRESADTGAIAALLTPIAVLPWSRRSELATFVVKEAPD